MTCIPLDLVIVQYFCPFGKGENSQQTNHDVGGKIDLFVIWNEYMDTVTTNRQGSFHISCNCGKKLLLKLQLKRNIETKLFFRKKILNFRIV